MNMELSALHLPSLAIGLAGGALLIVILLLPYVASLRSRLTGARTVQSLMGDHFKTLSIEALQASQQQFLALAQEKLANVQKDASFDLEKRQKAIAELVDPIGKTLKDVETQLETLGKSGAVLDAQLKSFADDQKLLRTQTTSLVQVLKNSQSRGNWGEMQLTRILEMVGMVQNTHFRQQVNVNVDQSRQRPDFIIDLPGRISIVIDVKTPLEPYWDLIDRVDQRPDDKQVQGFSAHLRNHVKQLSSKDYWRQFDSPQFVVMFLPTEGLFSLAVSSDKTLIEDAAANNVILASPTTVLGLLRVIMYGWQQQALADNAQRIGDMAVDLNGRMRTFIEHLAKVGRNLKTANNAFDDAVGSMEKKILPQLRKMSEYQGTDPDLPDLPLVEHAPRELKSVDDKAA
jgi:DNA recombination protein RmuC